jgi:hypothetical protein
MRTKYFFALAFALLLVGAAGFTLTTGIPPAYACYGRCH